MNDYSQKLSPAAELSNVGVRRGEAWILRGVDWAVPGGACAAVLGPNGSGKSTLARILACHLWPTEGAASVLGARMGEANLLDVRRDVRLVQSAGPYDVVPELTAREVVLTGYFGTIGLYDPTTDEMVAEAERLLAQVGLSHVADHTYATMSSGERVRSLIARALVVRPKLLLLDEPTAGLDLLAREQVLATVQRLFQGESGGVEGDGVEGDRVEGDGEGREGTRAERGGAERAAERDESKRDGVGREGVGRGAAGGGVGSGVGQGQGRGVADGGGEPPATVFITHHVEELPPATSHVLLLTGGRVAAKGTPGEVLRGDVLSRAYGCEVEVRRSNGRYYVEVHPRAWESLLRRGG